MVSWVAMSWTFLCFPWGFYGGTRDKALNIWVSREMLPANTCCVNLSAEVGTLLGLHLLWPREEFEGWCRQQILVFLRPTLQRLQTFCRTCELLWFASTATDLGGGFCCRRQTGMYFCYPAAYLVNVTCSILILLVNFTRNVQSLNWCELDNMEGPVELDFLKKHSALFHSQWFNVRGLLTSVHRCLLPPVLENKEQC